LFSIPFCLRPLSLPDLPVVDRLEEKGGIKTINERLVSNNSDARSEDRATVFARFLTGNLRQLADRTGLGGEHPPVVISGMASSSVGWKELPYADVPFPLDGTRLNYETFKPAEPGRPDWTVHLISGVRTVSDIMRGEETEILGLFQSPDWRRYAESCLVLLPGTHSKHVLIRDRAIVDFHTYMTGELYEVLATQSLLRFSVETSAGLRESFGQPDAPATAEFLAGVQMAWQRGLSESLFQVRTRQVLHGVTPERNNWFLSGLLHGAEAIHLVNLYPDNPIVLAASEKFQTSYRLALETVGAGNRIHVVPVERMAMTSIDAHALLLRIAS
jgi:2-dehydro-3-deoxygalactonokinase